MTYTLRAGDLDRRVNLLREVRTPHPDTGELIASFTPYANAVPARVVRSPGREFLAGAQVVSERRAVFVIRWRSDVVVTDRVEFEGVQWNVVDVRELGRRVGLEVQAEFIG